MKFHKIISLILGLSMLLFLNGCISPKTDAFLLGAGVGAGGLYYFLNDGKIDGISSKSIRHSLRQNTKSSPALDLSQTSIPSELEWYYFEEDFNESLRSSQF